MYEELEDEIKPLVGKQPPPAVPGGIPRSLSNLWHAMDTALHRAQMLQRLWASNQFMCMKLVAAGGVKRGEEPRWPVCTVLGNVAQ